MLKLIRRLSVLAVALCLALGITALAACEDDPGDENVTYTVTVTCADNTSLLNALTVQLKTADGAVVAESRLSGGTATFTAEAGTYTIALVEIAGFEGTLVEWGFIYPIVTVTKDSPSATIDIVRPDYGGQETVTYLVTVLYPDGTPAANISVQLCGGPSYVCNPSRTDESGVAAFEIPAYDYEVHIDQKVEGFQFDNTKYTATESTLEITVYFDAA